MCTSIISNRNKTIVGWNLDIKDMEHRVITSPDGVFIEVKDETKGWMPLFGADRDGNVLWIVPGQGYRYFEKPEYKVMTNFSPYKMNAEGHPWMGWDRYQTAERMLSGATDDFDVDDCFRILEAVSQTVCPTVVSTVFDVSEHTVHWCENREWNHRKRIDL